MTTIRRFMGRPDERRRADLTNVNATGSNPTKTFTISEDEGVDIVEVHLNGLLLTETVQYRKSNTAKTVTMVDTYVFNPRLSVFYNV